MIQDIYPYKIHNEYRPQAVPKADSPVLCFRDRKVLARLVEREKEGEEVSLEFPTLEMLQRIRGGEENPSGRAESSSSVGQLVYAFAVDETEYFMEIWREDPKALRQADGKETQGASLQTNCEDVLETDVQDDRQKTKGTETAADHQETRKENPKAEAFESLPEGFAYQELHLIRRHIPNVYGMIVFTGFHLHMWYNGRRFCGCCGTQVVHDIQERAVLCPACGQKNYPRIMPAVIVGVINGDKLLQIKNNAGFHFYALIAGFTEIGETLEETAAREVMEETGLKVKNIRYYKSQPWGIAGDVLAGFYCDLDGDDTITLDRSELALAVWRSRSEIELQPDNYSLTNEMMRRFKEGKEC